MNLKDYVDFVLLFESIDFELKSVDIRHKNPMMRIYRSQKFIKFNSISRLLLNT